MAQPGAAASGAEVVAAVSRAVIGVMTRSTVTPWRANQPSARSRKALVADGRRLWVEAAEATQAEPAQHRAAVIGRFATTNCAASLR